MAPNYTLLPRQEETEPQKNDKKPSSAVPQTKPETKSSSAAVEMKSAYKNGGPPPPPPVPIGVPVGDPRVEKNRWESGIFSCLGKNDEFYSSDVEVCLLGSMAPCVLHGSNVERLGSGPNSFSNNCLPYAGLYVLGNCFFGWNCLAPWYSYPNRTAIRHKFNLEGSCEGVARTFGCSNNVMMNEAQREQCESMCDMATHVFCHPCALCQEAREIRRKVPHPAFTVSPVFIMLPPGSQTMAREA